MRSRFSYLSNGDDFLLLHALEQQHENCTIDKIGDLGPDPGSGWSVAGTE